MKETADPVAMTFASMVEHFGAVLGLPAKASVVQDNMERAYATGFYCAIEFIERIVRRMNDEERAQEVVARLHDEAHAFAIRERAKPSETN